MIKDRERGKAEILSIRETDTQSYIFISVYTPYINGHNLILFVWEYVKNWQLDFDIRWHIQIPQTTIYNSLFQSDSNQVHTHKTVKWILIHKHKANSSKNVREFDRADWYNNIKLFFCADPDNKRSDRNIVHNTK